MIQDLQQEQQSLEDAFTEIGSSNFEEFACSKTAIYVDKTNFIKAVIKGTKVLLFSRPRRWGKTLNMSMLEYFFSIPIKEDGSIDENKLQQKKEIFSGLKIGAYPATIEEHCAKYPVIFISFAGIKTGSIKELEKKLEEIVCSLYNKHEYLLNSNKLTNTDKSRIGRFLDLTASKSALERSILYLSEMLAKHYGKQAIILIDEYDAPLNDCYIKAITNSNYKIESDEYFQNALDLFRNMFESALKTNTTFGKGIVTGILRVAKANLFSGLNNFTEDSILDENYATHFGFTEDEVNDLIKRSDISNSKETISEMRSWYNGYNIGGVTIYNPWSIMNWLNFNGQFKAYWVGTASTTLLEKALILDSFQEEVQNLIEGNTVSMLASPHMVFSDITSSHNAFYNLLLFSGYLTVVRASSGLSGTYNCQVRIPNREVLEIFQMSVVQWLEKAFKLGAGQYHEFAMYLLSGNIEKFSGSLKQYLERSSSYFDSGEMSAETLYNGFMLGIFASSMVADYFVEKERETGDGRADLLIIPKTIAAYDIAFVLEYKVATKTEDLVATANIALEQIKNKNYISKIKSHDNVHRVFSVGLAFCGKHVEVAYSELALTS